MAELIRRRVVEPIGLTLWLTPDKIVKHFVLLIGMGPVPWVMVSELFPPNVRAQGSAITSATSWMATFVVTNLFQPTEDVLGASGVFWLFATICFFGSILLYFFIPETKGKTLQEIQEIFN